MARIPLSRPLLVIVALGAVLALASSLEPAAGPASADASCFPGLWHASGSFDETIETAADGTRRYRLHVPPSYNGADPVPLVFSFHGLGSTGAAQELYSGFSVLADSPSGGFIAVYPEGTPNQSGTQFWNVTELPPPQPQDVAFVDELLDRLTAELCVDTNYVYSSGMSNGAMMSVRLACSLSARVAAIGPVAGAYYPPIFTSGLYETCPDTRAVPSIAFHGTDDDTVPYDGGPGSFGVTYRLAQDNESPDDDVLQSWAAHNGCVGARDESNISGEVRLIQYDACTDSAIVQLYAVDGGGHTWPGAVDVPSLGYTTHDISATELMWAFFQAHPLAVTPVVDSDGDTIPNHEDDDNDNDGCPDASEAGSNPAAGGGRNAKNTYDYFNPTKDGQNRIDDVLAVLMQYFMDDDDANPGQPPYAPGYNPDTDRTLLGPNPWNLGPPDGLQRVDDVLYIISQYFHDCA